MVEGIQVVIVEEVMEEVSKIFKLIYQLLFDRYKIDVIHHQPHGLTYWIVVYRYTHRFNGRVHFRKVITDKIKTR